MSSNRLRFQRFVEGVIGCNDLSKWPSYKAKFLTHQLSDEDVGFAKGLLREDAADLYYKSCLSLCQALFLLRKGHHSWPVVNLYYSAHYAMRAHLAVVGVGIVKNKGLFKWNIVVGETPERVGSRGDHRAIIKAFSDTVRNDVLGTNAVAGDGVYSWLMARRERMQYVDRTFFEPLPSLDYFHSNIFSESAFEDQVCRYIEDDIPVYCFDPDHCMLAAPLKRFLDTKAEFKRAGLPDPLVGREGVVHQLIQDLSTDHGPPLIGLLEY